MSAPFDPQLDLLPRTPAWVRRWANGLFAALVIAAVLLMFAPWQQTASGTGRITAFDPAERKQSIHAAVSGRVERWHVREGSRVKKGEPLVDLVDLDENFSARLSQREDAVRMRLAAAEAQAAAVLEQVKALQLARTEKLAAATQKIAGAQQKKLVAAQEVTAAGVALKTAKQNEVRNRQLEKEGLAAQRDVELATLAEAKAEAQLNKARAKESEADAAWHEAKAQRASLSAEMLGKVAKAEADHKKALADVAKLRAELLKFQSSLSRQAQQHVVAPADGIVSWVLGDQGENVVKAGTELLVLIPDVSDWGVELWVAGNDVPLVTPGRKVRMQFEGWPAVQMVGWPQVAVGTFGAVVAFVDPVANKDGKLRVMVVPDDDDLPWPAPPQVRQGTRAKGWILLDEVSLGFELWRRMNGFPVGLMSGESAHGTQGSAKGMSDKGDKLHKDKP